MLLLFPVRGIAADVAALRSGVVKITSTADEKRRTGTGFIVKLEADAIYIVTAYHVVEGDKNPQVEFFTRPDVPVRAEVQHNDLQLDVALLVVRGQEHVLQGLLALRLDPADSLKVGQDVTTIGFPPRLQWAVSKLSVASQVGLQFALSGAIDEGNSGGPVLKDDAVVAMVVAAERMSGRVIPAQFLAFVLQGWRIDISKSAPAASQVSPAQPPSPPPSTQAVEPFSKRWRDCEDLACPWLVTLAPGHFMMGELPHQAWPQDTAVPRHEVHIAYSLAVMEAEVTRGQFRAFVDATNYSTGNGCDDGPQEGRRPDWRDPGFVQTDDHPVVCVNWYDAQEYAQWLSTKTGRRYRLPSEAEWEYAARAGSKTRHGFGESYDSLCDVANVFDQTAVSALGAGTSIPKESVSCADGHVHTAASRTFRPNAWGLYDMYGNAAEWVQDCIVDFNYKRAPVDGSSVDGAASSTLPIGYRAAGLGEHRRS